LFPPFPLKTTVLVYVSFDLLADGVVTAPLEVEEFH
jgi:hypothetical protein